MLLRLATVLVICCEVYRCATQVFWCMTTGRLELRRAYFDSTLFSTVLPLIGELIMLGFFVVLLLNIRKWDMRVDSRTWDAASRLTRLERLRASGVISADECQRERLRIIGE